MQKTRANAGKTAAGLKRPGRSKERGVEPIGAEQHSQATPSAMAIPTPTLQVHRGIASESTTATHPNAHGWRRAQSSALPPTCSAQQF